MTTVTSREFNQDSAAVKRAAADGPVFVTDRGKPALVVMTYEDFRAMSADRPTMSELLSATPGVGEIDFEPQRLSDVPAAADFD